MRLSRESVPAQEWVRAQRLPVRRRSSRWWQKAIDHSWRPLCNAHDVMDQASDKTVQLQVGDGHTRPRRRYSMYSRQLLPTRAFAGERTTHSVRQ